MSTRSISTHILDTSNGLPATGVQVTVHLSQGPSWNLIGQDRTNSEGRVSKLATIDGALHAGPEPVLVRIKFDVAEYFQQRGTTSFYPWVEVRPIMHQHDRSPLTYS